MTGRPPRRILHSLGTMLVIAGMATGSLGQRGHQATGDFMLDRSVAIVVSSDEPQPVRLAAEDLAGDFEKVLGTRPNIVTRVEDAGQQAIVVSELDRLSPGMRPRGLSAPESFSIAAAGASGSKHTVVLCGADMRGTIYAIYQFSQEHLGIDPMYYWTDHLPQHRSQIALPSSLAETFPAPVFKYRGFFINDEDLLTGWAPGDKDKTGISLEAWNKVYETILRLKGNMVVPGTWIFPDDAQIALAGKRGLILTQHHAIPLGLNVARWPKDVPYNYSTHPEILERAWKDAVATYSPTQEILYQQGHRRADQDCACCPSRCEICDRSVAGRSTARPTGRSDHSARCDYGVGRHWLWRSAGRR
jgi:hypothetical protein